jgi:hypothetical protein
MNLGTTSVPFVSADEKDESHYYQNSMPSANVQPMQTWRPAMHKSPPAATAEDLRAQELLPSTVFSPEVQQKLFRSREVIARAAIAYQNLISALTTSATGLPDLKDPRCWHNEQTFALQDAQRELADEALLQRLRDYVSFIDADRTPQIGLDMSSVPSERADSSGHGSKPSSPKRAADMDLPTSKGQNFRPFGDNIGTTAPGEALPAPRRADFENGYRMRTPAFPNGGQPNYC